MYLWRKRVTAKWLATNEWALELKAGDRLAIIDQIGTKHSIAEVSSESQRQANELKKEFGGSVEKLPRDWLKRYSRAQESKPLKVGKRLVISREGGTSVFRKSRRQGRSHIVIPASVAFGTGDHATTAMSLRMLERVSLCWGAHAPRALAIAPSRSQDSTGEFRRGAEISTRGRVRSPKLVVDLGTGSGILALAAKIFGAKRVIGIDNDPMAISVAKQNARLNKINGIDFRVGDVLKQTFPREMDLVMANLFSELLIEILPKIKSARRLILSGVLRTQEAEVLRALRRNKVDIVEIRRRGKWIALLVEGRIRR